MKNICRSLALMMCLLAVGIVACNEGATPIRTFTPEPYTTVVLDSGTPIAVVTDGAVGTHFADRVEVSVGATSKDAFVAWALSAGFAAKTVTSGDVNPVVIFLTVPAGSVPAAIDLIEQQKGVLSAQPEFIYRTQ